MSFELLERGCSELHPDHGKWLISKPEWEITDVQISAVQSRKLAQFSGLGSLTRKGRKRWF